MRISSTNEFDARRTKSEKKKHLCIIHNATAIWLCPSGNGKHDGAAYDDCSGYAQFSYT